MEYEIKRGNSVVTKVRPNDNAVVQKGIMNANLVRFDFETPEPVFLQRGDYITVYGEDFDLNKLPPLSKDHDQGYFRYSYNCIFESIAYRLAKVSYHFLDNLNRYLKSDFAFTGTLDAHLNLLVRNANRIQSGWTVGVVDLTVTKTIVYSGQNCLQVLATLATEFNTEWWVENKTIHMTKKGKDSGLTLSYGINNGLYSLSRRPVESTNVANRIYAQGSTKNLPASYRNYASRLQLPEVTGGYLQGEIGRDGIIEYDLPPFEDIYPRRNSALTDVIDIYTFADTTLEFDINEQLLPGVKATIVFNSGPLQGYEFEINNFKNEGKVITINPNKDEKALEIPSAQLHAEPGDIYVLIGIKLPESDILKAELEVQERAQQYLDENIKDRSIYSGNHDPIQFEQNGIQLKLGDFVKLLDTDLDVLVTPRVVNYEQSLHNRFHYPVVEYSEHVNVPKLVREMAEQQKVNQAVLKSDLVKPNPTVTPVAVPTRKEIVFNKGYVSGYSLFGSQDIAPCVYWKDNNIVFLSGIFTSAFQNPEPPYLPFNLPLGFRPWYNEEVRCPIKIYVYFFNSVELWGTLHIKKNGDTFVSATLADGQKAEPNQIVTFDLSGVSFYTGMDG